MDNNFKLSGIVKLIGETTQVSDRFKKRDLVVTTDITSSYPQHITFQVTQDKCSLLDNISVNDNVEVSFNISGREWTSPEGEIRYFNSLNAWRIESLSATTPSQGIPAGGASAMDLNPIATTIQTNSPTQEKMEDDLPF